MLDLKGAYDTGPRNLMKKVKTRLTGNTSSMIVTVLQRMVVKTVRDSTNTNGLVTNNVPQGAPVSPAMFNLFIYGYAELSTRKTKQLTIQRSEWAVTMFADDVKRNAFAANVLHAEDR